ncbi:MAG: SGNH/GDSL hydrolase family protein [Burkholderia sp.]|jgi:hypothetical protein
MENKVFGTDYTVKPLATEFKNPVKKVLLVGNSFMYFNCGVNAMIAGLAKSKGRTVIMTLAAISGASLYWHDVRSYLRPNGLRSYAFSSDGKNTLEFIKYPDGRIFDAVVLEDSSQGPIHPELSKLFAASVAKHVADIRAVGSEPMLMMTWAYKNRPEMTRQLADAITSEANKHRVPVAPCGLAFARAQRELPGVDLIRTDNRHPTVPGTYLEACVFYAGFFKETPEGSDFFGKYSDVSVNRETGEALQRVAWESVCDFNGWDAR